MKFICVALLLFMKLGLYAETAEAQFTWPHSETNHYELIGSFDLGVVIPLPDFTYKTRDNEHQWYEHSIYSHRRLAVTIEGFHEPTTVKKYADGFSVDWKKEIPSIELIRENEIVSRSTGSILRRTWKDGRDMIHQLFVIKNNLGICLTAYCAPPTEIPEHIVEQENKYWERLMDELARAVQFTNGQAKIIVK